MAYTFRTATTQGNASGGALTVNKPTGTLDGDLIIVNGYLETDTNSWTSVGAGFNVLRQDKVTSDFSTTIWWKIASSEPASWTWTPNVSGWRTVLVASYSGATATGGNQVDVDGTASVVTGAIHVIAPSVTTNAANDLVCCITGDFAGGANSETGFATNERADFGGCIISDAIQATAGATGTTTVTDQTTAYIGRHVAFLLSAPGASSSIPPGLGPVVGMQEPQHFDNALMR